MTRPDKEELLRRAARRAATDAFFFGSALAAHQTTHGLDEAALAAWLGCTEDTLARLALCRRPDPTSGGFRADVEQIAAYTGAQPLRLGTLLREVAADQALRGGAAASLLAARDADSEGT